MILLRLILIAVCFFSTLVLLAQVQEICDNGIDDDGDGLIDLNDPDCECQGIVLLWPPDVIPNPSFETFSCCPSTFSQLDCATPWQQGNGATTDYMHTCGFILPSIYSLGLLPFPGGEGIAGMVFSDGWKEYLSVCLNEPIEAGANVSLSFWVACLVMDNFGNLCNGGIPTWVNVDFVLYGNATCNNLTVSGTQCPSGADPNWIVLGTVSVAPVTSWVRVSISFSPNIDISAIMLGPPCFLPPGMGGVPCLPYYAVDDLILEGDYSVTEIDIVANGLPCTLSYSLEASMKYQGGGSWQWYYEGVALQGQNASTFNLSENNYQSGTYQVVFFTSDGCVMESIDVIIPPFDTTVVETSFCYGDSDFCGGVEHSESGEYTIVLKSGDQCDSIVICRVTEFDYVPPTILNVAACFPYSIDVCSSTFEESGIFQITCRDRNSCDSLVILDLKILDPVAYVLPPDTLICDDQFTIILDGSESGSNPHPQGRTLYYWTGPEEGFAGPQNERVAVIKRAGQYCLEVAFEVDGTYCSDTYCVTVHSKFNMPEKPDLSGPTSSCTGELISYRLNYNPSDSIISHRWFAEGARIVGFQNLDSIRLTFDQAGLYRICAANENLCGLSDTTCMEITISTSDSIFIQRLTCDSLQVGVEITALTNQYGCDSVVILQTLLSPTDVIFLTEITCDPALARLDTLALTNQYGCDSTIYIEWRYQEHYRQTDTVYICSSGTPFSDTLIIGGTLCDSLFITDYIYIQHDTTLIVLHSCNPGEVGIRHELYSSSLGCDSVVVTQTLLLPSHEIHQILTVCDSALVRVDTLFFANQYGCDSIVYQDWRFESIYISIDTIYVCNMGLDYTDSVWVSGAFCDSLFVYEYIHIVHDTVNIETYTCHSNEAGRFVEVYPSSYGCDSVVVFQVILLPSQDTLVYDFTCFKENEGIDSLLLVNQFGCDSLVVFHRQYVGIDTVYVRQKTCHLAEVGTRIEFSPGIYCDTVKVIETTFSDPPMEVVSVVHCEQGLSYTDTLIHTLPNGCDSIEIRNHTFLGLDLIVESIDQSCFGMQDGEIYLSYLGNGLPPIEYRLNNRPWQPSGHFRGLAPGLYTVALRDSHGCVLSDTVHLQGKEPLEVDLVGRILLEKGDSVRLDPKLNFTPAEVLWTPSIEILCDTCLSTLVWPSEQRVYLLMALDQNGCELTAEVLLLVRKNIRIYAPNSFTPNGDGINDRFTLFGPDIKRIKSMDIYDRWGNRVFQNFDFQANDSEEGWDGRFKNQPMDPAVFVYVVEVELLDGNIVILKGDVTLIK